MTRTGILLVVLASIAAPMLKGDETLTVSLPGGRLEVQDAAGRLCWTTRVEGIGRADVHGEVIEVRSNGGRVARLAAHSGTLLSIAADEINASLLPGLATLTGWTDPQMLIPAGQSTYTEGLLFDAQGNALLLALDYRNPKRVLLTRSQGHSGMWDAAQNLHTSTNDVFVPRIAIDPAGNIMVIWREISGGYNVRALRYTPDGGWGSPQTVFTTSQFFQDLVAVATANGDVLVLIGVLEREVQAVKYDAASDTWSMPTTISDPESFYSGGLNVQINTSRDAAFAPYFAHDGSTLSIQANRYDFATGAWLPAETLPGSTGATFSTLGPQSLLPAAVSPDRHYTTVYEKSVNGLVALYGSRGDADSGTWQPAEEIQAGATFHRYLEELADLVVDAQSNLMLVFKKIDDSFTANELFGLRYDALSGWEEPAVIFQDNDNFITRQHVAFMDNGSGVVTFLGKPDETRVYTSILYDGANWGTTLYPLSSSDSCLNKLAADGNEAVDVYKDGCFSGDLGWIGTWLRGVDSP